MPAINHHPSTFRSRYPTYRHLDAHLLEIHRVDGINDIRATLADLEDLHSRLHQTSLDGQWHWHEHPDGVPKFQS